MLKHINYGASIRISRKAMEPDFVRRFRKAQAENRQCLFHKMGYLFFVEKKYRLYRRGKNRCLRCGIKING